MSQPPPTTQTAMVHQLKEGDPEATGDDALSPPTPDPGTLGSLAHSNRQLALENLNLRAAIMQSNQALRERCEELQEFQTRNRREKEFVVRRFSEARQVVEKLREANSRLSMQAGVTKSPPVDSAQISLSAETTLTQSMFAQEDVSPQDRSTGQTNEDSQGTKHDLVRPGLRECHPEKLDQREERMRRQEAELEMKIQTLSRQIEQLSDDKSVLKAQATSLLAELTGSQTDVEALTQRNTALDDRCRALGERLRKQERESEEQRKQSSVAIDQLRISVQNSESALKTERQSRSEDRRKLAQLQAAYHQLFAEYDHTMKDGKRNKGQSADIEDQLKDAETALALKQELIDKLKEEGERLRGELETIPVLKAQAEVFEADFLAERLAREKLHEQRELLQERMAALQSECDKMRGEQGAASRAHFEEMQRRHSENPRTSLNNQGNYFLNGSTVPFTTPAEPHQRQHFDDDLPGFWCPKCQYRAPDMDTLQIHVMDCIQ